MPKGDVPTEWYSPTQPFPVKPAQPMVRVEFDKERDMVRAEDTSPEHVAECQALYDKSGGFYNAGPFTPFKYHEDGTPPKSTITFPGGTGGVNWGGTAADPATGLVYMNAHDTSLVGWVEKKKPGVTYSFEAVGSEQAVRPRQRERPRPVLHLQRAAQGREREGAGAGSAVPASAVGAPDRGQRQHRRGGVEVGARAHRGAPRGQAAHGQQRQRRPERDGGRPGVRRRHQRSPLPRLRRQDAARSCGARRSSGTPTPTRCRIRGRTASSTWRSWPPIPSASLPCRTFRGGRRLA